MYGTNIVARAFHDPEGALRVHSVFYTLQGEGPDAGRPSVFIRLGGCNLRCFFCDTAFEGGEIVSCADLFSRVQALAPRATFNGQFRTLIVITGGEPLLQNILPFVKMCNQRGFKVSVETAGTVTIPKLGRWFRSASFYGNKLIVSPKTPVLNPEVEIAAYALKYIIAHDQISELDGLPTMSTQINGKFVQIARPNKNSRLAEVYVQPMDVQDEAQALLNRDATVRVAMRHGYRLSLQTHKIVGVP